MKKKIINLFFLYNIHIGHSYDYNTSLNYFIIGKRLGFFIIDISKAFFFLKKALFFIHSLSVKNCSLLFYNSTFNSFDLWYKCLLVSLIKRHSQSIVVHNWIYGSISNYYFTFFHLIKAVNRTWFKTTLYNSLNHDLLKKNSYYFFNSDQEDSYYSFFHYKFLILNKKKKITKKKIDDKSFNWYNSWLKKQQLYGIWRLKQLSRYYFYFLKKLFFNDIYNIFKKKRHFSFKYLFLKLFYFIRLKKKNFFFWDHEVELKKKSIYIHKKFMIYWRLILYFKYFNSYFQLPEALFCVFPNSNDKPLREYSNAGLSSIGLVDTTSSFNNVNYPIISNDDSIVLVFFYCSIISNILFKNKLYLYNSFYNSYTK